MMATLEKYFPFILETEIDPPPPWRVGKSRQGRDLSAYRFGDGEFHISLIGGCHADEPTGPRLLKKLVSFLSNQSETHPLITAFTWIIVPHLNPDGEAINKQWYSEQDEVYDLPNYLLHRVRELPGDDLEYGFPEEGVWPALRPENQFVYDCWRSVKRPFQLHASLHGMPWANGAWFLFDAAWQQRSAHIIEHCTSRTRELGYELFDVDRKGEKGFTKIADGFSTRPDAESMRLFFLAKNDPGTASKFHPSSMESVRSLGGDCLTLVSEMPLFIYPQHIKDDTWPNPEYEKCIAQMSFWAAQLQDGTQSMDEVKSAAKKKGIVPMPVADQMALQWCFISAGIEQVKQQPLPELPV